MNWLRALWSGLPYDPREPRPCPRCEDTITWGDALCPHCGLILRAEGRPSSPARPDPKAPADRA
jgi:predicted amidophosphoribosyltransferase